MPDTMGGPRCTVLLINPRNVVAAQHLPVPAVNGERQVVLTSGCTLPLSEDWYM